MKKNLYSVRDNKTSFWTPVEGYSDPAAVRDFEQLINKNEMMVTHASDFDLYRVGTFDSTTGSLVPLSPIEFIISGSSVVYGGSSNA